MLDFQKKNPFCSEAKEFFIVLRRSANYAEQPLPPPPTGTPHSGRKAAQKTEDERQQPVHY